MFCGSTYIYLELNQSPTNNIPLYIKENIPAEQLMNYSLPSTCMIKYRSTEYNIEGGLNILQMALREKEWNVS